MSGFHRYRLRQLKRAARLDPMPSYLVPGMRLPGDRDADFINSAYFSPEALRWADAVCDYRASGGAVSQEDEECFARVWEAMRAGRKPTDAQTKQFTKDQKWKRAEARVPELYAIEMRARGHKNYGPDNEVPNGVEEPGSWQELIYKYQFRELGYKSPASAKARHNEWKAESGVVRTDH